MVPSGGSIHPHVHEPISRIVSISPTSGGSAVTKTSLNFFATVYEKTSKSFFGDVVVHKGANELAVGQLVEYLDSMGYPRVVFKTDGENPITALMRAAKVQWAGDLVVEESPLGDSNSNGAAEVAVKTHQGLTRTLKLALEQRIGCSILDRSNAFAWMARWAPMCNRRYHVGEDGWTSDSRASMPVERWPSSRRWSSSWHRSSAREPRWSPRWTPE